MNVQAESIRVGISSCLMGEHVRFDGGHKRNSFIMNSLAGHFEFVPFCPEVHVGLGTPREAIRLVDVDGDVRALGTKTSGLDVTDALHDSAQSQLPRQSDLCGYILKKDSPSCGMERVRIYNNNMPERKGIGLYAGKLMQNYPHLPVEEEGRLEDPVLRENFIQRVFVYARWKRLMNKDFNWKSLTGFHARHKYIYMSHNQGLAQALGRWLAENTNASLDELQNNYLEGMMAILKEKASRKTHTNTLMHIQGYLKNKIDNEDKQELVEVVEQYRVGLLPLIVPITLLKHHFRKFPHSYISDTYYMQPHPSELMLLNNL